MLRQHKPSFIHLRSRGMIFGTPCRRSFPWRRSRPTGFSSGPWKWQAHRASGTSRRSHPSWACLQGKLMNSIVPRMIFLMFRQPPALTDYRNIRNMHFKNQRWLDSKKNQEWWTVIPWESSHLYWWLEFPKTGIEPPLPRWECDWRVAFSRLPSSCRYWADRRRQENATFQLLPFPSVY